MSETKQRTYYELLGTSFYASEDDLRRGCENALRRLDGGGFGAEPDAAKAADIAEQRRQIMQAYAMLKDPARRAKYNAALMAKLAGKDESATAAATASTTSCASTPNAIQTSAPVSSNTTPSATSRQPSAMATSASSAAMSARSPAPSAIPKPEVVDLRASMQARIASGELPGGSNEYRSYGVEYAHLGVRFAAMMIDSFIVLALTMAFVLIAVLFSFRGGAASTLPILFAVFIGAIYYMLCESGEHRSTWGKRWMGLEVVRSDGETSVGKIRGFLRYFLRQLSSSVLLFGYLMAFFTEQKQALHDKISDVVVIRAKDPPVHWLLIAITLGALVPLAFGLLTARLAKNIGSASGAIAYEMQRDNQADPTRATPLRAEVAFAYASGVSLQRALKAYYDANGKWPLPQQSEDIIAQATRADALRQHDAKIFPGGTFILSLGGTKEGTARLLITPLSIAGSTEWICASVNIDENELISECSGDK